MDLPALELPALEDDLASLRAPDGDATATFEQHLDEIVAIVDEATLAGTRLDESVAGARAGLLLADHLGLAEFMVELFRSGSLADLPGMAVWAHRLLGSRGVQHGYFTAHLAQWPNAFERLGISVQMHEVARVCEWLLDHDDDLARLAARPAPQPVPQTPLAAAFSERLSALDLRGSLETAQEAAERGLSATQILTHLIAPALERVGTDWENGTISPAEEHRALAIANRVIGGVFATVPIPEATRGTAIVTAVESEFHDLGALSVAAFLEDDGWDVHFLGANTPNEDVAAMAARTGAELVAVSVINPVNLPGVRDLVARVHGSSDAAVIAGGGVLLRCPTFTANMAADLVTSDGDEALKWAAAL